LTAVQVSAADSARRAAGGEDAAANGLGIGVALLYALGAIRALDWPHQAAAAFVLAGLVGVGGGLAAEFGDLAVWGACAPVPTATSVVGARRRA
jgi:hypothetical protein